MEKATQLVLMEAHRGGSQGLAGTTGAGFVTMTPQPMGMTQFKARLFQPVNTLVVGPGNYGFFDFVRIGVPFAFVAMVTSVLLVPPVFPF